MKRKRLSRVNACALRTKCLQWFVLLNYIAIYGDIYFLECMLRVYFLLLVYITMYGTHVRRPFYLFIIQPVFC